MPTVRLVCRQAARPRPTVLAATLMFMGWSLVAIAPASAQTSSFIGNWTGMWDGRSFVEYDILKADRRSLTASYVYKSSDGFPISEVIHCRAVSADTFNCGASTLVLTSAASIEATMHATNGVTAHATLSR